MTKSVGAYQKCINPACGAQFDCGESMFKCPQCGDLLDIQYDWDKVKVPEKLGDVRQALGQAG